MDKKRLLWFISQLTFHADSNPLVYHGTGAYRPGSDPYSVTQQVVNIWKKHGFYWGGDWKSYKDYMHFTYTNN